MTALFYSVLLFLSFSAKLSSIKETTLQIIAIAAIGRNRQLGLNGTIPFQDSRDRKLFKEETWGSTIIMGRKTFESIGHALPHRRNMVLSRSITTLPGAETFISLDVLLQSLSKKEKCFVIGGGEIYDMTLSLWDTLYLSIFDYDHEADVFFPDFTSRKFELLSSQEFPPQPVINPGFIRNTYRFL